jgi:hypothetical protein
MGNASFEDKKRGAREGLIQLRHAAQCFLIPMQCHAHDDVEEIPDYGVGEVEVGDVLPLCADHLQCLPC